MTGSALHIDLLGRFSVTVDGRVLSDDVWRRRRAAAVVKMLALAPGHRLAGEVLVDGLWPDLDPQAGSANLRKAAYHARQALGSEEGVVLDAGMVQLLPGGEVVTDVEAFQEAARRALDPVDVDACRTAAGLYKGELLPDDRYASWCARRRDEVRDDYLAVLRGGELWGRLLEIDPADERAHREIIRAHVEAGDRRSAIRQFDSMRKVLREELGVSPDPETVALYERVLAMEGRDVPTPAERARALLAWGVVHWERSDLAEAERTASEVRALAIDAGLGRELADASELLGLVAYAQGRWREVFGEEFVQAVTRSPELAPFVFDANLCMTEFALEETDGVRATAAFAEQMLAVAGETGSLQARALGLLLRGEARLHGDPRRERARTDLAGAARLCGAVSSIAGRALATERLAQAEADSGRTEHAWRLHQEALELARASSVPNHLVLFVLGGMLGMAGQDAAAAVVEQGEAAAEAERVCDPCSMPFRIGASTAYARTGDVERAWRHHAEAERVAGMWQGGPWHAALLEVRAAIRRAEGAAAEEVMALLRQAADGFAAAERPGDEARCRVAAAALA